MAAAIQAAFTSLFSSSLTTVAGFLALCFMRLLLGRDIGIVMAKGVVLGVATVILVLPALLLLFDKQIEKHKHRSLLPDFTRVNGWIVRRRRWLAVLFLLLFPPGAVRPVPRRGVLQAGRGPAPGHGLHRGEQQAERRV